MPWMHPARVTEPTMRPRYRACIFAMNVRPVEIDTSRPARFRPGIGITCDRVRCRRAPPLRVRTADEDDRTVAQGCVRTEEHAQAWPTLVFAPPVAAARADARRQGDR